MRKIAFRIKGIAFTTNEFEVRGKKIKYTEEDLKIIAPKMKGIPLSMGHRGIKIGFIEDSWYEEGKVKFIGAIYEPITEREQEAVEKILRGKITGVSAGFMYPIQRKEPIVIHGDGIRIIEKKEDGSLIVGLRFSKREIEKKIGSIENLSKIKVNRIWFHNGTDKAKKEVEKRVKKHK